jgi:phenylalanyl-tRNA synthetase alpha chain
MDELESYLNDILERVKKAETPEILLEIKREFLSAKSPITSFSKGIKALPNDQKKEAGKAVGEVRASFFEAYDAQEAEVLKAEEARKLEAEKVDITLPVSATAKGARHPLQLIQEEIADFFISLGWRIEEGPELESEWYNFDALNFGPDHPARQMQDTFYVKGAVSVGGAGSGGAGADASAGAASADSAADSGGVGGEGSPSAGADSSADSTASASVPGAGSLGAGADASAASEGSLETDRLNMVLRTHTSPVQARSLLKRGAPLYVAAPGRVFRTDELDATHTPVFHQVEGLAVDKHLTMANLKGVLDAFAKAMFGESAKTRLRPSYFPFTEPSAEMDVWFEGKQGGAGWIEWGGCGMVHPNVLLSTGVDPNIYSGFAFGIGLERTLQLRHNIQDMHDIVEGDVRFSRQF